MYIAVFRLQASLDRNIASDSLVHEMVLHNVDFPKFQLRKSSKGEHSSNTVKDVPYFTSKKV